MRLSHQALVTRAHALAPVFAARAQQTEIQRALLDESLRDLSDSGVLATLTPECYGRHERPIATLAAITAILSAACRSTGWVAAFYMGAAWRMLTFPHASNRKFSPTNHTSSVRLRLPLLRVLGASPRGIASADKLLGTRDPFKQNG